MAADCLFCRIVAGEIPSTRVHEDDEVIAFRDIAPRAPTHILVIPRRHIASAADLTDADGPLLGRLFAVDGGHRPRAGHRGRRLPRRHERRALGRADRRPPAPPPDGRPAVRVAARMRPAGPRRAGSPRRARLAGVAGCAGCGAADGRRDHVPAPTRPRPTGRQPRGRPDARGHRGRARRAAPDAPRHADAVPPGRGAARWPRRRGPSTRSCLPAGPGQAASSSSTSSPTRSSRPRRPPSSSATSPPARAASSRRRARSTSSAGSGRRSIVYDWLPGAATDPDARRTSRPRSRRSAIPYPVGD